MKKLLTILLILGIACTGAQAIANPWTQTTAEEILQTLGLSLRVPEDAQDVVWRMLEPEQLAELQFVWQGAECTARIQPADGFTDISGLYYAWDKTEACEIGWCAGEIRSVQCDGGEMRLCLWYDVVPGLMYSLSASGENSGETDMIALAGEVYLPAQGDV